MTTSFDIRAIALPLFAVGAMGMSVPALAQSNDGPGSIAVRYDDLDVGHPAGAKVLLQRIEAASIRVCGGQPDPRDLEWRAEFDQCRGQAVNAAIKSVNSPLLAALHGQTQTPVLIAHR